MIRVFPFPSLFAILAQLVEHCLDKADVGSSNLSDSIKIYRHVSRELILVKCKKTVSNIVCFSSNNDRLRASITAALRNELCIITPLPELHETEWRKVKDGIQGYATTS